MEENFEEIEDEIELTECYAMSIRNYKDIEYDYYGYEEEYEKYISPKRLEEYEVKGYFMQALELKEYIEKYIEN